MIKIARIRYEKYDSICAKNQENYENGMKLIPAKIWNETECSRLRKFVVSSSKKTYLAWKAWWLIKNLGEEL